ncbi:MAG: hypothetical protein HQL51_16710 [Magnetococcales bacterium]|nr:hypothetical protein [Magnetococcales bacterium]
MSGEKQGTCWSCGQVLERNDFNRRDYCPGCKRDLRCCKNCRFYDEFSYNECREPESERVTDKEKATYCDFFEPRYAPGVRASTKDELRMAAESLFKKKS